MTERIPPQDLDAEQSVLGAMMISKDAVASVLGSIQSHDFYHDAHGNIFKAILSLSDQGEPIDLITVASELKKLNFLQTSGGKSYLAQVANSVPTSANVTHYASIVHEKAVLRQLIETGTQIVGDAFDDTHDVDHILNFAQQTILTITKDAVKSDFAHIGVVANGVWDDIGDSYDSDNKILGISTGLKDLDMMTSGFQKSDLVILAARPAMGKTTLAMNFAMKAAFDSQKNVAFFSLEMPKEQLALRILSSESKIDLGRIRTGQIQENEYQNVGKALGKLSETPIYIDDTPSISPLHLRSKCRRLQMEQGLDMVVIDYLQLMRSGKRKVESRFQEVSEIVRELKSIAKELSVPIIALSQLSRDIEKRGTDASPKLSDLRESGEIEQTADLVMFINRDDYYDPGDTKTSFTHLIIAKQRNGPTGVVELVFRKDVSRFELAQKGVPMS